MRCAYLGRLRAKTTEADGREILLHECDHPSLGGRCTPQTSGVVLRDGTIATACATCPLFAALTPPAPVVVHPKGRCCYFTCDTRPQGPEIMASLVASARRVGVAEDIYCFSAREVPGAITLDPGPIEIKYHLFKLRLLRDRLAHMDYDYFVWLDSDNVFVRHPGDLKPLIRENPFWCLMESDVTSPKCRHGDWWGMKIPDYLRLLTDHGVTLPFPERWNTNGGMWIVRREAIAEVVEQALGFHAMLLARGYKTTHDETPLAWLGHTLVDDPRLNTQQHMCETWACDWQGHFTSRQPDGQPWTVIDWMTGEERTANPAIVHAMRAYLEKGAKSPPAVAATKPPVAECAHRGQQVRIGACNLCGRRKGQPFEVFGCTLYDECSLERMHSTVRSCRQCIARGQHATAPPTSNPSRTIVLTGCTRGVGRALVARFVEAGHTVIGCGRSAEQIDALRLAFPGAHRFDVVDVTDDQQVRDWAAMLESARLEPDLLITNAGVINSPAPLWTISAAKFDRVVRVNLCGVANVIRHFVPAMVERRRGVIVNVSSGWGRTTAPHVAPYCATKHAIEGLSASLAQELPPGLTCVAWNPGIIDTDLLRTINPTAAGATAADDAWSRAAATTLLRLAPPCS